MVYLRIALAEANTDSAQLLFPCFISSSKRMARSRCSRKFSSIMKNEFTFSSSSMRLMTSNSSSPVSKKLTNFPLPPKNAEVVQKLQPMGQPTEGIMVAAVAPFALRQANAHDARAHAGHNRRMPDRARSRLRPDSAASRRCLRPSRCGRHRSSFRFPEWRPHARRPRSSTAAKARAIMRHISRTLPTFTMMPEMPTMSY